MSTILLAATNFFGGFEHTTQDHGVSDWICMEGGTVTYSVPYAGTNIIESNVDGSSETTRVSNAAAGSRGTFSITAGKLYHGSNAINLFCEGEHHRIVPITNRGTKFGHYARRSTPTTYYVYNPNPTAIRIDVYDAVSGGISGTATTSFIVASGSVYSSYTNSRTSAWVLFESVGGDAVMSARQNGADRSLMYPADTNTYIRRSNRSIIWTDMLNSAPASSSTYTAADATNLVLGHTYADGAGGDDENAVGLNYLADRYSFGNAIGDYFIAAPYASTTATVKYWNGSSFATYATYSLNGSLTNPAVVQVGAAWGAGTNLQGGATHWLWEANNPIFVAINDTASDEESMLGWMANRTSSGSTRNGVITTAAQAQSYTTDGLVLHVDAGNEVSYPDSGTTVYDITGSGRTMTLNGATYESTTGGRFNFDGSNDYMQTSTSGLGTGKVAFSLEIWANFDQYQSTRWWLAVIGQFSTGALHLIGTNQGRQYGIWSGSQFGGAIGTNAGSWQQIVFTFDGNTTMKLYENNSLIGNSTGASAFNFTNDDLSIGLRVGSESYYDGKVTIVRLYNKALSSTEVAANYNADKTRHGLS